MSFIRTAWPACRDAVACTASSPIPPADSGLDNSTTTAVKEGEVATYACTDDTFTLSR